MSILNYENYRDWILDHLKSRPKGGHGQFKKMADSIRVDPTIVTQVLKGEREFTPEQALLLADYFGLSKYETHHLVLLVNYSRAGSERYRQKLLEEIKEHQEKANQISSRVADEGALSDEAKSTFYSNWYYLAIWSLTAIQGMRNVEEIADRLGLQKRKVKEALEFLFTHGLVQETLNEGYIPGPTLIHLDSKSSQIVRHHQNWRLKAFEHYDEPDQHDLTYTAVVTLSKQDRMVIREKLLSMISECVKLIGDSTSEELYAICLDWYKV